MDWARGSTPTETNTMASGMTTKGMDGARLLVLMDIHMWANGTSLMTNIMEAMGGAR